MKYDIVALYVCIDDFSKIYEEWENKKLIGGKRDRRRKEAQSSEIKAQSSEPRAQSAEPRAQSSERRAQSPEPRAQSAEHRA